MFAVGILSALRSIKHTSQTIGVMITASHNPPADNGVKIVEPNGDMLVSSWESYATALANAGDMRSAINGLKAHGVAVKGKARVCFARDTRVSGPELVGYLKRGLECFDDIEVRDFGEMTTPQLHYVTRCLNDPAFGEATEEGYYTKMARAFKNLVVCRDGDGEEGS